MRLDNVVPVLPVLDLCTGAAVLPYFNMALLALLIRLDLTLDDFLLILYISRILMVL